MLIALLIISVSVSICALYSFHQEYQRATTWRNHYYILNNVCQKYAEELEKQIQLNEKLLKEEEIIVNYIAKSGLPSSKNKIMH